MIRRGGDRGERDGSRVQDTYLKQNGIGCLLGLQGQTCLKLVLGCIPSSGLETISQDRGGQVCHAERTSSEEERESLRHNVHGAHHLVQFVATLGTWNGTTAMNPGGRRQRSRAELEFQEFTEGAVQDVVRVWSGYIVIISKYSSFWSSYKYQTLNQDPFEGTYDSTYYLPTHSPDPPSRAFQS